MTVRTHQLPFNRFARRLPRFLVCFHNHASQFPARVARFARAADSLQAGRSDRRPV
ncbi:hypothetical protein CKO_02685 [Citrobacter koseri ATCC BAA-895]|uniref:Uncharacterized protein n=1 Tax=Citrobacter koseri (strain ATCC BAA-895 / CDC 4225-83 / SGSC4696) TaxID=290338 RepID=A8AJX8_CITK8|nr:hypothetical protein CKO_02685 [Citrobacter koseri ATCC BAA-895]